MKIDRLLEIIIYLLNHETVSASALAERFHVSKRTIQRDMISISAAGIPVYSNGGKCGGYSILPSYKMKNCGIREDEQQMIRKALESFATSYVNETLNGLLEKYHALSDREEKNSIYFDFGIARENQQVQSNNVLLEQAVADERLITFSYRDAVGKVTERCVQPLAVQYKWYSWYLFAWSVPQDAYRTFKIARMDQLKVTGRKSGKKHPDIKTLIEESDREYCGTCETIEVHFRKEHRGLIEEYFPDSRIESLSEERCRVLIEVPPRERLWKALLLSLGDKAEVISPEIYRNELIETAQKFLSLHDVQNTKM